MSFTTYSMPKGAIINKLKEIGLDQQEDRVSPEKEMVQVVKRVENYETPSVEYSKTIYNNEELGNMERGVEKAPQAPTVAVKTVEVQKI